MVEEEALKVALAREGISIKAYQKKG